MAAGRAPGRCPPSGRGRATPGPWTTHSPHDRSQFRLITAWASSVVVDRGQQVPLGIQTLLSACVAVTNCAERTRLRVPSLGVGPRHPRASSGGSAGPPWRGLIPRWSGRKPARCARSWHTRVVARVALGPVPVDNPCVRSHPRAVPLYMDDATSPYGPLPYDCSAGRAAGDSASLGVLLEQYRSACAGWSACASTAGSRAGSTRPTSSRRRTSTPPAGCRSTSASPRPPFFLWLRLVTGQKLVEIHRRAPGAAGPGRRPGDLPVPRGAAGGRVGLAGRPAARAGSRPRPGGHPGRDCSCVSRRP